MLSRKLIFWEVDTQADFMLPGGKLYVPGAERLLHVPEALTEKVITVPNEATAVLPRDLAPYQQILLEKQTLDVFESRHAAELVKRLPADAEFIVFGVVTEYCVRFAAKGLLERGRRVSVVQDAIETLNAQDGERTAGELRVLGAKFITTERALALL